LTRKGGGHVGFVMGQTPDGKKIVLLGGNQGDEVKLAAFARSKFVHFAYPKGETPTDSLPIVNITKTSSMR